MTITVIRGGHVVTPVDDRMANVVIENGKITGLGSSIPPDGAQIIDATGCWVTPGLIDLQVNGGKTCDFWDDPDLAQVAALANEFASAGVTTILPTLITDDLQHLRKNLDFLENEVGVGAKQISPDFMTVKEAKTRSGGAVVTHRPMPCRMPGVHLEGPCLSPERPGVHPTQHLQPLNLNVLKRIITNSVKLITLAPELDPSGESLEYLLKQNVVVALGHSNATFEEAKTAFDRGIKTVTHTFNAMAPLHHRSPGAVTAAMLDDRVTCCVICDGQHLAPGAVELILRTKKVRNTVLVTDVAHVGTSQGGLVGSSILLDEAVRNVVKWGITSFQDAILMASYNPAMLMGWHNELGHLAPGKLGDVVIWDKQSLAIKHVIVAGKLL